MIRAILCDIEGTTSSIHFVKEVLFPYAREHLPAFLRKHYHDPAVREQLEALWQETPTLRDNLEASITQLLEWIAQDQKRTPLKALQGMIWKKGYECGAYRAHIYPDAIENLRQWHQQGLSLFIYSSGSVAAQNLFFQYSEYGDVRSLFQGYFDTTSGPKQSPEAYASILREIAIPAQELLFLSDIEAELDAAKANGIQTCWLTRPEDCPLPRETIIASPHPSVSNFHDINLDTLCS